MKADPYATRAHKAIDVLLLLITALIMLVVFRSAMHDRAKRMAQGVPQSTQTQPHQLVNR